VSSAPIIETERLILRGPRPGDHLALAEMLTDPEVHRYLGPSADNPVADVFSRHMRGAGSWALYGYGFFMAHDRESGDLVGQGGVFHSWRGFGKGMDDVPEAGWTVARPFWDMGYGSEIMHAALGWFERSHGAQRIACMIEDGNTASFALAARLGFLRYDEHVLDDGCTVGLLERLA
jgi:RimJ/RimL family protein N-acetyltransferase